MLAIIWLVYFADLMVAFDFSQFGIFPRTLSGLPGIIFAPILHSDLEHIQSNSAPLFFLISGMFLFYRKVALKSVFWIWILTGFWVWVSARASIHIGASGLIFGAASFIFFSGIFSRDRSALALSMLVAFFYGGMIWGVLPLDSHVSFESHLFGLLAGLFLAFRFRKEAKPERKKYSWEDDPDQQEGDENAAWNYPSQTLPPRDITDKP